MRERIAALSGEANRFDKKVAARSN